MFQRSFFGSKEHLQSVVVRRLLQLRFPECRYRTEPQAAGYADQLVLDDDGKVISEVEVVGPGNQHGTSEMDRIVQDICANIAAKSHPHLAGYQINLRCVERDPSKEASIQIVQETCLALEDKTGIRFSPDGREATVSLSPSSINFVREVGLTKHTPNPDGSSRPGTSLTIAYYLGAPLPFKKAIKVIADAIRGKTEKHYKRSSTAPLELLVHSSGFSDIRWSPEPQFSDELTERVKRDRSVWKGFFERVWLLSANEYREVG